MYTHRKGRNPTGKERGQTQKLIYNPGEPPPPLSRNSKASRRRMRYKKHGATVKSPLTPRVRARKRKSRTIRDPGDNSSSRGIKRRRRGGTFVSPRPYKYLCARYTILDYRCDRVFSLYLYMCCASALAF